MKTKFTLTASLEINSVSSCQELLIKCTLLFDYQPVWPFLLELGQDEKVESFLSLWAFFSFSSETQKTNWVKTLFWTNSSQTVFSATIHEAVESFVLIVVQTLKERTSSLIFYIKQISCEAHQFDKLLYYFTFTL